MNEEFRKIKNTTNEIRKEAKKQVLTYITAALGLVAGLAWNEAIKGFIEYLFPVARNTLFAKFIYAIAITLVIIIISFYLARLIKKEKD